MKKNENKLEYLRKKLKLEWNKLPIVKFVLKNKFQRKFRGKFGELSLEQKFVSGIFYC